MRNIFILITCLLVYTMQGQYTIFAELLSKQYPIEDYILKNGEAKKIKVKTINNPNDELLYIDEATYNYQTPRTVQKILYRDGELLANSTFELDSLKQITQNRENFKHNAIGWQKTHTQYIYTQFEKEIRFLNTKNEVFKKIIIEYDSLKVPLNIVVLDRNDNYSGMTTATYNFEDGIYLDKVFNYETNSLVSSTIKYYNPNFIIEKNEMGDITRMYPITSPKGSNIIIEIKYKYDKKGNWIKQTRHLLMPEKKKVLAIITRKISYKK